MVSSDSVMAHTLRAEFGIALAAPKKVSSEAVQVLEGV